MNIRLIGYYVLILILLFMLALMFYYYLLLRRKISINKRLLKYSVYHEDNSPKLFDNIGSLITKFIQKISKLLYKSKFLTKYSLKYQKYILVIIIFILLVFFTYCRIPKNLKIYFIDVGQGDSCLIITPNNKKILIDSGGSDNYDVGKNILLPYLLDLSLIHI